MPNVAPHLTAQIYDAWAEGDYQTAFAAQRRANDFAAAFRPLHGFLHAAGKAVLSRLGLMEKWVAPPKTPLTDAETDRAFETVKAFLPEFDCL
jgi:dihydrodipicolinate synthase/N-acetylneuraminate lyase